MRILQVLHLFVVITCFTLQASAQDDDYVDEKFVRYEDRTYVNNIKTVQFHVRNVPLSLPVIRLGSNEQLQLSFDELDADFQDYTYTVVHCDRDWNPSNIPQQEYLDGFLEETILNYDFSFNTVQQFIHYSFSVPNQNLRLKLSGNYVLMVYRNFNREEPIITRRFRVYEDLVRIDTRVRIPMVISQRRTHQQIDVEISHPDFQIRNPFNEIAVHIQQNYRWDNMITDLKPMFVKEKQLIYNNMGDVLFEGSNEFRWIDTRSLRYQPENVSNIWYDPDSMKNHVFLVPDKVFSKDHYRNVPDINGAFSIGIREGSDPTRDADYALVHMQLRYPDPVLDGGIYLFGGLTDWQVKPEYRLDHNPRDGMYEGDIYLKQGYYNYQYMYVRDGETKGETEVTEGSFFEARQIYTIYVYHQQMGSRYDRLIGHTIISSQNW